MLNTPPSDELDLERIEMYFNRPWLPNRKDVAILDIGCGYGTQLYALSKLGFSNLHGIEIARELYEIAAERLGTLAHLERIDAFTYLGRHVDRFDLVILQDVLEHIPREKCPKLLELIKKSLKLGGVLTIRVPNMSSLLASYSMYLDFSHVTGFTEYSLMQLLDIAGFVNHKILHSTHQIRLKKDSLGSILGGLGIRSFLRSWVNVCIHKVLYKLREQRPVPKTFDFNLEIYSKKG